MWRCSKCETINNDENYCYVCGEPRPAVPLSEPANQPPPVYAVPEQKQSKGLVIAVIIALCVLVIVGGITVAVFLLGNRAEEPAVETTVETAAPVEEIYYVNTFDDSGIYVRAEPDKKSDDILYIKKGDTSVKLRYLGDEASGSDGYIWYHVEISNGDTGYVREDVVKRYYQ